jgi:hypothetical protein
MIFQDRRRIPVSVFMVEIVALELWRVNERFLNFNLILILSKQVKKFKIKHHNSKLLKNFEYHQHTFKK